VCGGSGEGSPFVKDSELDAAYCCEGAGDSGASIVNKAQESGEGLGVSIWLNCSRKTVGVAGY
jgi:hypothetical protein